jgi:hypothetical protein
MRNGFRGLGITCYGAQQLTECTWTPGSSGSGNTDAWQDVLADPTKSTEG